MSSRGYSQGADTGPRGAGLFTGRQAAVIRALCGAAFVLLLASVFGCGRWVSVRYDQPPSMRVAASEKHFAYGQLLYRRGELAKAASYWLKYQQDRPGRSRAPQALLRAGEAFIRLERYERAKQVLTRLIRLYPACEWRAEADYQLARALFRMGNYKEAYALVRSRLPLCKDRVRRTQMTLLLAQCAEKVGRPVEAVAAYTAIVRQESGQLQVLALNGLKSALSTASSAQIQGILAGTAQGFPRGYLTLGLARAFIRQNNGQKAVEVLDQWLKANPAHALQSEAQQVLSQAKTMATVDMKSVGCILPLSGRLAPFGRGVLKSIMLALGVLQGRSTGSSGLSLVIRDSKGDPETAVKAVEDLVKNNHVAVIIGPMASPCAIAAAKKAEEMGVVLMALSQHPDVAQVGKHIFRNFLSAQLVVRSLVNYVMGKLGLKRFAILYPDTAYGQNMMKLFFKEVQARQGQIRAAEKYQTSAVDFGKSIRGLTRGRGVDFDALFIPDVLERVALIGPQLNYYNILKIKILGTNLLATPETARKAGRSLDGAIIVGGFNPKSESPSIKAFVARFKGSFGREPGIIEAYGYDTAAIIRRVLTKGAAVTSREGVRERLAGLKDFPGITGRTRFDESGEAVKSLPLLTIKARELVPVGK